MKKAAIIMKKVRVVLGVFTLLLAISGITAFPIETELSYLDTSSTILPGFARDWLSYVKKGVQETNATYPFIFYGTDWLAFGHIVIALFFIGAIIDPVKNIWNIKAGMLACLLVFPLAFIAGHFRGIPLWWQLVDCSFGFFRFLMLGWCYRKIQFLLVCKEDGGRKN